MNRMTSDNPDGNLSTLLNFAYAGDDRRVKIRNGDTEADLCDYICEAASIDHGSCGITSDAIMEGGCMDCDLFECPSGALYFAATQAAELRGRLKMIEDILGDTYDLDRLRELMVAEREGRIRILPCVVKPGDNLYIVGYLDSPTDAGILGPHPVVRTTTEKIYYRLNHTALTFSILDVSWSSIGKSVFLTLEEAEAAMEKIREGGNGEL